MIPNVDLSTLGAPELRQLLDATRRRGQADLTYQILQEMAARREAAPAKGGFGTRRRSRSEPRLIELNLGDPLEKRDEFDEEPEPLPAWNPGPQAGAAPDSEAEIEAATPLHMAREPAPVRKTRRPPWVLAGFAAGIAVGVAVGRWAGAPVQTPAAPPATLASAAAPAPAIAAPIAPPVNALPQTAPDASATAPAANPAESAPPASEPVEIAEETAPPPPAVQAEARAETADAEAARPVLAGTGLAGTAKACAAKATPADQAICGSPELQRLQRDLRAAYAVALDAHRDRDILRQRLLAWRDARNDISDPERLIRLYEQRIRTLNSATADARREREKPALHRG